jgi:hypothetical protein
LAGIPTTWNDDVDIGARYTGVSGWDGLLDEYVIYNTTLTDAQILDLYNSKDATMGNLETPSTGAIYSVTNLYPANLTRTNHNPPYNFTFYYNGSYPTANCTLWVEMGNYGSVIAAANTTTNITPIGGLAGDGLYGWFVNCTNGTSYNYSGLFDFTLDTAAPGMTYLTPTPDNETLDWDGFYVNVSVNETASYCFAEINGTNYTMTNIAGNNWRYLLAGQSHEDMFVFMSYCSDTAGNGVVTPSRFVVLNWPGSPGPSPGGPSSGDAVNESWINPYEPDFGWDLWLVFIVILAIIAITWVVTR